MIPPGNDPKELFRLWKGRSAAWLRTLRFGNVVDTILNRGCRCAQSPANGYNPYRGFSPIALPNLVKQALASCCVGRDSGRVWSDRISAAHGPTSTSISCFETAPRISLSAAFAPLREVLLRLRLGPRWAIRASRGYEKIGKML